MPAFSVISIRPSGRNAIAQGDSKSATTCTWNGRFDGCGVAPDLARSLHGTAGHQRHENGDC